MTKLETALASNCWKTVAPSVLAVPALALGDPFAVQRELQDYNAMHRNQVSFTSPRLPRPSISAAINTLK